METSESRERQCDSDTECTPVQPDTAVIHYSKERHSATDKIDSRDDHDDPADTFTKPAQDGGNDTVTLENSEQNGDSDNYTILLSKPAAEPTDIDTLMNVVNGGDTSYTAHARKPSQSRHQKPHKISASHHANQQNKNPALSNKTKGNDHRKKSVKKQVAWQVDRESSEVNAPALNSDTDRSNPSPNRVNVDSVVQTDSLSQDINTSLDVENKGIKDPGQSIETESLTSQGGMGSKRVRSSARRVQEGKKLDETESRLDDTNPDTTQEFGSVGETSSGEVQSTISADVPNDKSVSTNSDDEDSDDDVPLTPALVNGTHGILSSISEEEDRVGVDSNNTDEYLGIIIEEDCEDLSSKNTEQVSNRPLLFKRRPASASGVWTSSTGRFWGEKSTSEDSVRPSTAIAAVTFPETRRFSLPLCDSREPSTAKQLSADKNVGWESDNKESTTDFLTVPGANEHSLEKPTKKAVLVTYSDLDQSKAIAVKQEEEASNIKNKPPRPSSSSTPDKRNTRQRPSTGGETRTANRRPSSRPKSSSSSRSSPSSMGRSRRQWELGFSKEELQRALPRKSFYNSHNKALKEAGYEVEEDSARPRRRRLVFFHPDEDDKKDDKKNDNDRKAQGFNPPVINEPEGDDQENGKQDDSLVDMITETAVGMLSSFGERARRRKSGSLTPAVVECKPLQLYLTYVRDNPAEYRHMVAKSTTSGAAAALHPSSHAEDSCHTARLVSMGRIFQERQMGGPAMGRSDEVLRAAYALNPRAADPNRFAQVQRDKSPLLQGLMGNRKLSMMPNFQRKESAVPPSTDDGNGRAGSASKPGQRSKPGSEDHRVRHEAEKAAAEQPLLEVEKRRLKAEEWARTVTTDQLLRAKLHVLKELGHEERELSQWWVAFRTCFYLRSRIREVGKRKQQLYN